MQPSDEVFVGIAGAAGRGKSFRAALEANGARIRAVCDIRAEELDKCAVELGAEEKYADYGEMLERSNIDAVIIGTPMPLHVAQAVPALERSIHALSEVPAAVSFEECRRLVTTATHSRAVYMLAENFTYMKPNVFVRELVRQGYFGETYFADGEYIHELKQLNETTPWRRTWQTGIRGVTYGTHSLGPILQWMAGDRVTEVCCADTGSHYRDPRGEPYAGDSATMLCRTARGALIKIRVDMVSDRPHAMTNYQLQGVDGCYESSRGGPGDRHKIWLRCLSEKPDKWFELDALMQEDSPLIDCLPDDWRNPPEEALRAGHGGGDYFEVRDFLRAIRGEAPPPVGIHEAMDYTLPGLVSQQSVLQSGAWLPVPDSRDWEA
ncbi:MAG: Gfo/Idh/MocA family oxidoreductase [Kiritimatiellaeota bacterium]|nr:Gfo/Idh/MocA family oxidoreductase [Kiritimatiellota bacterium]